MKYFIPDKHINLKSNFQIFLAVLLIGMALAPAQIALAAGTYTVNRADDIAPRGVGSTCITPASSDCTLREAVIKANANPGSTIQFAASLNGTPIVLARTGNDATASAGDLDINASTNIVGNGSANTIIQGSANASYAGSIGDKVFGINQDGTYPSLTVHFTGVTIRYGDNNISNGDLTFAYTGGGVDVYQTGTGNVATFTDCVISFNRNRNSYGGGMNFDQEAAASGSLSLTNVTFDSNKTMTGTGQLTGGALNIFGVAPNVTISNSAFTNNSTTETTAGGGAIYYRPTNGGSLSIHNSDIYSNTSGGIGGGIYINNYGTGTVVTIDQGTQIRNNVSGGVAGGSAGGSGIFIGGVDLTTTPMLLSKVTISGNHDGASATSHNGGGGIYVERANVTIQYSRIVSNTVSGGATGTGLFKSIDTGAVTATNNWWGCSTGPGAAPCDTAVIAGGSAGSLSYTPYFRVLTTPGSATIVTNQTTSLTASVNTNSAGTSVSANVDRLLGLPVTWSAVNGTISGADATISPSGGTQGTAAATFTATTVGAGKGIAKVDNDSTTGAGSNIASITINKANTTAAITSDLPDPSVTGQPVTVSYTVTGAFGNSPTAPTGNVTVSDGTNSCIGTVAAGSCNIALTTAGARTLTASYAGDTNFNGSDSTGVSHTVNQAPAITSANSTTFEVGAAGTFAVTTTGTPAVTTITKTGSLPSGVIFTDNSDGTATLSGTPAAGTNGNYSISITASNGVAPDATQNFTLTVQDTTAPTVNTFTATSPSSSLDIPITAFTASDNNGVTGYMITQSSTAPLATDPGWSGTAPATYTVGSAGSYTLYPWAKDGAGNVSAVFGSPRNVTVCYSSVTVANANDSSAGSLRQAIADVCPGGAITFAGDTTISLLAQLVIDEDLTIDGAGHTVTISGQDTVRVFYVNSGVTATLNHLTITHGNAGGSDGGGIYKAGGVLTVTNSTLSGNSADYGGGIYNADGDLTVSNSTLSGNSATTSGGGIYNADGALTVTNSTVSGNSATTSGGGIYNYSSTLNYANTIIANSPIGGDCYNEGMIGTNTNNLVEDGSCSAGASGDPLLGDLADNGGPTWTMALGADSPAIDAGDPATCAAAAVNKLDQRGQARNDLQCDIGAFELKFADSHTVSKAITGPGTYTFGPTLAKLVVSTQGCLTGLNIERTDSNHPNATLSNLQTGAYWSITPTCSGADPFEVTLSLPALYFSPGSAPKLCRWSDPNWDCGQSTDNSVTTETLANGATQTYLQRQHVAAFSNWTAGNNVGPTAVGLSSLKAQSPDTRPLALVGLAGLALLVCTGLMLVSRKRPNNRVKPTWWDSHRF
jgi:hypothetical protein